MGRQKGVRNKTPEQIEAEAKRLLEKADLMRQLEPYLIRRPNSKKKKAETETPQPVAG